MPVRTFILVLFFAFVCSLIHAQNNTISGAVTNSKAQPVAAATVSLLDAKDSAIISTQASLANGSFAFKQVKAGRYLICITATGYTRYNDTVTLDVKQPFVMFPAIILQDASGVALKAVTVTANKPLVERKIDRTIINTGAMITATGSSVLELLGKSPGVTVDINGGISLYGRGGVLVLMDDKQTYMSGADLAAYLRSLPGSMVERIELMSNPPAKYDASGSAVINIILKKNRMAGFNGNANIGYNQGVYGRTNDALNINYRVKMMNIFGDIGYNGDRNFTHDEISRYYINAGSLLMDGRYQYTANSLNARAGVDYFATPKTTLGVLLTAGTRQRNDYRNFITQAYDAGMKLDSTANGSSVGNYNWHNTGINFNLQHNFDSIGKNVRADIDYIHYSTGGSQISPTSVYFTNQALSSYTKLLNEIPAQVNIWSAKVDYTQPLKNHARLDAGLKSSYVTTNDASNWFNSDGSGFTPDYSKTNRFIYWENINAIYVSAMKEWKRWSVQGGLRIENNISNGHQLGNANVAGSSFTRHNTVSFPTIYILRKLDSSGNSTLVFSYGVRIRRPNYQQLNPFVAYQDKYSYTSGNPLLDPMLNHVFNIEYSYKGIFGMSLAYLHLHNEIYNLTQMAGDTLFTRPQNFGTDYSFNFRPYVSFSPVKAWHIDADVLVFHLVNRGSAYGSTINNSFTSHEFEVNNQFRFNNGWGAELNGFFPGRQGGAQTTNNGFWRIDAGLQKTLLHNQANIRLTASDIFHTVKFHNTTMLPAQMIAYGYTVSDTQRFGISFNYRFGKQANARKRNHNTGGAEDENGRVN